MTCFNSIRRDCLPSSSWAVFLISVQIFFGLLFLIISPVSAATDTISGTDPLIGWVKSFGPEVERGSVSIIAGSDNGSVASGYIRSSPGNSEIYVIRTDNEGEKLWDLTETVSLNERYSLIETPDKGYVIAGSSNNSIANGIVLQKFDQSGKKIWARTFNKGEYYDGTFISITRDGGFIVAGSVLRDTSSLSFLWDGYILKTDAEGREVWTGFFTGEKNDFVDFILQTEDGGYVITGTTESYGGNDGSFTYLLKMNEFGNKEWFSVFENGSGNEKSSVIQTPDGGYILLGSSLPDSTNQRCQDLFLIRTDDLGKELWRKNYYGMRPTAGNLNLNAEGIAVITGSCQGSEPEKNVEIILLDIDVNGNERKIRTFSIGQPLDIQDITVAPGEGYFVAGTGPDQENPQKNTLTIIKVLYQPPLNGTPVKNSFDLAVKTKDAATGTFMGGVHVYLDGESVGSTAEQDGKQTLHDIERGIHTIRVAKTGYEEVTSPVEINEEKMVSFTLNHSKVIPIQVHGSTDEKIDIIFVASETSFNCNSRTKIQTAEYTADQERFVGDVRNKIDTVFLTLDTLTSGSVGLPKDFRERYNFYYYWDTENFADAFDGCAGSLPDRFWNDAPFTDVAIILYPSYVGFYTGSKCEPNGCANGLGPGSGSWLKASADSSMIFLHESGHVVFGLIDTYCGDTYYIENSPFPNVWSSEYSCQKNAEQEHWDPSSCRQILKPASIRSKDPCVKDFWRADPDPDIMGSGAYSGRFGNASTLHIRYIFDTINRWQK